MAKTSQAASRSATKPLNDLSATEAAQLIASGKVTSEQLVRACLDRIEANDANLKAWVKIEPDRALAQARARDKVAPIGALHGVPVGVKDVLDTSDLPTQMGSSIYKGYRPRADAACVAQVRAAGAVILGKTATCEFAGMAPTPTVNPHDPSRTPGGSSSGSAAAVADCMVPFAFGTQTGGSILRPASYCGIVGYKPTYGLISHAGLKLAAESFDTIGVLARNVDDAALLAGALTRVEFMRMPSPNPPRIGLCWTHLSDLAQPETTEAVERIARGSAELGARVKEFELPPDFARLGKAREIINAYERARGLAWEWNNHRDALSAALAKTVELGWAISQDDYEHALQFAEHCRARLDALIEEETFDILIAPCVNGEAPAGLEYTGDPRFQSLWTLLHVPTLSLPTASGPNGMPVGVQLISQRYDDHKLLRAACWIGDQFGLCQRLLAKPRPRKSTRAKTANAG
jgi:Asp-tRNA(Asn)/Glu-tRNA(Gln) amidotransferase A subunit family amidase